MWVFLNNAYVSIVQDRHNSRYLWVRARIHGDVERFFKGTLTGDQLRVERSPAGDYLYRTCVDRHFVAEALLNATQAVDYPNFKNSIPTTRLGNMRHDAYLRVWTTMMALQQSVKRAFKK
jgi:hypothetical protein